MLELQEGEELAWSRPEQPRVHFDIVIQHVRGDYLRHNKALGEERMDR